MRPSLRVHFLHQNMQDTEVILEEGNLPHPWFPQVCSKKNVTKTDIYLGLYRIHIVLDPFTDICTSSRNTLLF